MPRISPDGARAALDVRDEDIDILLWDFARETLTRFTPTDETFEGYPLWTPDGTRIAYSSGPGGVFWKAADGSGAAEQIVGAGERPYFFSPGEPSWCLHPG